MEFWIQHPGLLLRLLLQIVVLAGLLLILDSFRFLVPPALPAR